MPERIQRKRARGWRLPEGAKIVDRTSRWGNPWRAVDGLSREEAVRRFDEFLRRRREGKGDWYMVAYPSDEEIRAELAGWDLACWCPLPADGEPDVCHAAALLAIANERGVDVDDVCLDCCERACVCVSVYGPRIQDVQVEGGLL
jgi:hypothetical protein